MDGVGKDVGLEVVCIEFGITYKDLRGRCRR
jgi:hypothetical protein